MPAVIDIRRMTPGDVDGVIAVCADADADAERRAGRTPDVPSQERATFFRRGMQRFLERDPAGAFVALDGARVVGMAEAIRRGSFWGLSMLFVHPESQSQGIGRRLLERSLTYADGADVRMICTSGDPRALRRYALAGLAIHPAVGAQGRVDRSTIPAELPGREGSADDLDLVAAVDARLLSPRTEDVEYLLGTGARMDVIDTAGGRGYVMFRGSRLVLVGATDDTTAARLLWRFLAQAREQVEIWGMTAGQDWAVRVALAARLPVVPGGPLFLAGRDRPPGPWLPSGWYF